MMTPSDSFDDAFSSLFQFDSGGIDKPLSPNERFYNYLISGKNPRILTIKWFIKTHLNIDEFMEEHGCRYTKPKGVNEIETVTRADKVKMLLHYYLEMSHLTRFDAKIVGKAEVCDIEVMIDKLFSHETIQDVVHHRDPKFTRNF